MTAINEKPKWPYLHPIPVHFPAALFPAAFASFLFSLISGLQEFSVGAHVMSLFGLLATPVAIVTGFADWKIRYHGIMTRLFRIKIVGALSLLALALPAVLLRQLHADLCQLPLSGGGWLYGGLLAACVAACVVVGHYGARLVFH